MDNSTETADPATDVDAEYLSELFDVLSHQRRRYTLYCLWTYDTPMALADLTDEIVRFEVDAEPTAVPDIREQVYVHLYHRHLPKLHEADLVTFDMTRNLVSLGSAATNVLPYLKEMGYENPLDRVNHSNDPS